VSKETYYSVKRDLIQCQKRPTTVSKETYYSVKRDLLQCQKRPTTVSKRRPAPTFSGLGARAASVPDPANKRVSKETCYIGKRDLLSNKRDLLASVPDPANKRVSKETLNRLYRQKSPC